MIVMHFETLEEAEQARDVEEFLGAATILGHKNGMYELRVIVQPVHEAPKSTSLTHICTTYVDYFAYGSSAAGAGISAEYSCGDGSGRTKPRGGTD